MLRALAVLALHTLSWDSVSCIVEVTDRFSKKYVDQFLFQDYKTCARERSAIAAKYSDRRYAVTGCDSSVWLPWEQSQGPTQGSPLP
jgi:sulfur transfer protein SufE